MKLNDLGQSFLRALRREEAALIEIQKEELPSYREVAGAQAARQINTLKLALFDQLREALDKDNP